MGASRPWKQPLAPMIKSNEAESHGRLLEFPSTAKQNDKGFRGTGLVNNMLRQSCFLTDANC